MTATMTTTTATTAKRTKTVPVSEAIQLAHDIADLSEGVALANRVANRVRVGKVLTSPMGMASRLGMTGMFRAAFVGHLFDLYGQMRVTVDARVRVQSFTRGDEHWIQV